jgi:hypothetical protein
MACLFSGRNCGWAVVWMALVLAGCAARTTIESRRQERWPAYSALPAEQQRLVDQGLVRVGMPQDAVYIAWGAPSEILQSETAEGLTTTWIYHGQTVEETRYWTYREVARGDGVWLERRLETDYFPRAYISAEIIFRDGTVALWRTLPQPAR